MEAGVTMTLDHLTTLAASGESETLEFKRAREIVARQPEPCARCSTIVAGGRCSETRSA